MKQSKLILDKDYIISPSTAACTVRSLSTWAAPSIPVFTSLPIRWRMNRVSAATCWIWCAS